MAKTTEELDLSPVIDLLAHWWHMARMKATGEYEEVLEHAARVQEQIESGEYRVPEQVVSRGRSGVLAVTRPTLTSTPVSPGQGAKASR
jgi:hypothetical protein